MRRWREQDGLAAGADALLLGVLVFVVGTLLFLTTWQVIDAKFATSAAAREAVRVAAETPPGEDPALRALVAATEAMAAHGLDPAATVVNADGEWASALARCLEVEVSVTYRVEVVPLPVVDRRVTGFDVVGRHREVVDPFRSGLPTGDSCDF